MNVTVNIIAVGAVMSISSIENDTPTASASMLVARDSPIRFLVFHGQHDVFTLFPSSVVSALPVRLTSFFVEAISS